MLPLYNAFFSRNFLQSQTGQQAKSAARLFPFREYDMIFYPMQENRFVSVYWKLIKTELAFLSLKKRMTK